jgi:hypothetical protein
VALPSSSPSWNLRWDLSELHLVSGGGPQWTPSCVQRGPHPNQSSAQLHEAGPQPTLSHPAKVYKS